MPRHLLGKNIKYMNNLKNATELLEFYDKKYSIKKYTESPNNILIHVKDYNIFN